MRILMLGWELPPYNSGGLGVACYQLCRSLSQKGADIDFVLPYRAEHDIEFMNVVGAHPQGVASVQHSGIAYDSYTYTYEDGSQEAVGIFRQQERYEHAVDQLLINDPKQYDVIHAHDWLTFRAALRAKERTGYPLFVHVHSIERDRAGGTNGNPLVRDIEGTAFTLADGIIAVSQHTKDLIVKDYGIPADKIQVIHNSIDAHAIDPLDDANVYFYLSEMRKKGYRVVTNVGRLTVMKNLHSILHAAKEVVARAPKTFFLFVGSGEQYHELLELTAELGLSKHVFFVGFQRGKPWRDAYGVTDVFVMPSISEPFWLTALEAVGYGAPVLVSRQAGVNELIHNSLKVDFWDIGKLADSITAVVQNDALRNELHANAHAEFKNLSWDDSAHKILHSFKQSVSGAAA